MYKFEIGGASSEKLKEALPLEEPKLSSVQRIPFLEKKNSCFSNGKDVDSMKWEKWWGGTRERKTL